MKEHYTVRIYDKQLSDKVEGLYNKCKDLYSSQNPFLVDCISRGAELIEHDLVGENKENTIASLYDEIHLTVRKLDNLLKLCEKSAKETIANLSINQKLLSCNYNMLLGLSENNPKPKNFIENGMFDDLPERLGELLEDILKQILGK